MIDFDLDVSHYATAIKTLAASLSDVRRPLVRAGGHVRARARRAFEQGGPGWKPLAPSTQARKISNAEIALLRDTGRGKSNARSLLKTVLRDHAQAQKAEARVVRLKAQIDRAWNRSGNADSYIVRKEQTERVLRKKQAFLSNAQDIADDAGVGNVVEFARRELARQKKHGAQQRAFRALKKAGYTFTDAERRAMLRKGKRRYNADAGTQRILGTLDRSLGMALDDDGQTVRIYSKSHIGAIHNDGGRAGHGANIPARPFLTLQSSDLDALLEYLSEAVREAWEATE